mgnify:CR=1 FL=1
MYFRPKSIVRNLSIISCVIFINGCAMPLPFQVASWAIDGISYITTEKSVTDHGISFVAQKDCALLRIVQGQEICTNNEDNGIIAAIEAYPSWNTSELTEFELVDIQLANKMATTTETNLSLSPSFENNFKEKKSGSSVVPRQLVLGKRVWSNRLDANLYYVVGSFSNSEYAKSLIKKHSDLGPAVLVSFVNGICNVMKSDFFINNKVLTPRFETELLVEHILKIFRFSNRLNMIDLGLGSGCILISILKEKKHWVGTGVDLSKLAIKIAKTNAKIQQVYNRIRFINSDVDKYIDGKYDLVVSNPPYINKVGYNNLDVSVKDYEPKLALYGGIDGYKIIEKVIKKSKCILKTKGILAMEIGIDQKYKSIKFLENNGFYVQKIIKDYQNIDRHIFAIKL